MRSRAFLLFLAGIVTVALLSGCGESREEQLAKMSPRDRAIQVVLDQRCIKCHTPPNADAGLDLTKPANLLQLIETQKLFDDQAMYRMLMGDSTIAEHDRPDFQLVVAEIDQIREWVLDEHRDILPEEEYNERLQFLGLDTATAYHDTLAVDPSHQVPIDAGEPAATEQYTGE